MLFNLFIQTIQFNIFEIFKKLFKQLGIMMLSTFFSGKNKISINKIYVTHCERNKIDLIKFQ